MNNAKKGEKIEEKNTLQVLGIEPGPPEPKVQLKVCVRFVEPNRKCPISISVSSRCTKSVNLLLHTVMDLDSSPREFVHVH